MTNMPASTAPAAALMLPSDEGRPFRKGHAFGTEAISIYHMDCRMIIEQFNLPCHHCLTAKWEAVDYHDHYHLPVITIGGMGGKLASTIDDVENQSSRDIMASRDLTRSAPRAPKGYGASFAPPRGPRRSSSRTIPLDIDGR